MAEALYTAQATSSGGGRDGHVASSDKIINQDVKMPPALGGPGGATNPEQLFAAAYATCFHGAMRLVAKNKGVTVPDDATIGASVSLAPDDTSFAISAVINFENTSPVLFASTNRPFRSTSIGFICFRATLVTSDARRTE